MRVLCVNGFYVGHIGETAITRTRTIATIDDIVVEGEIYNVTDVLYFHGGEYYELAEKPKICVYLSSRFIPLSNINEVALVNNKEELVNA